LYIKPNVPDEEALTFMAEFTLWPVVNFRVPSCPVNFETSELIKKVSGSLSTSDPDNEKVRRVFNGVYRERLLDMGAWLTWATISTTVWTGLVDPRRSRNIYEKVSLPDQYCAGV